MKIKRSVRKALKKPYWLCANLAGFMILLCLHIIKPIKNVKIVSIFPAWRVGHLAANTDLFLNRLKRDTEGIFYLGVSSKPDNQQLLTMFKREFPIIQNDHIFRIVNSNVLKNSSFYESTPFWRYSKEYYEIETRKPNLQFTSSEEEKGKKLLKKMGLDSWFVCFYARDPAFLDKMHGDPDNKNAWSYHSHRDCDINNYLDSAEYISSEGGFAIRMGYVVEEELSTLNNPRIIDYSTNYRTDFGDIYLIAKCKFFLGCAGGLVMVPTTFRVPVAAANWVPLDCALFIKGDIFIPKKVWSIDEERFLTFREIMDSDICTFVETEKFEEAGVELIENTPKEILDLAKEMNECLNGTRIYTEEDEELQKKFWSLFKPHHRGYGTPVRIGAEFLRQNKDLLE